MIVLSDNDVILKLAQCDLLKYLPEIIGRNPSDIFIGPNTRFQLLLPKRPEKACARCGSEEVYQNLSDFLSTVKEIPEIQDESLFSLLGGIPHIDSGEQLLLASCMENAGSLFMTGDKRCLQAVMDNQSIVARVHSRLIDSVVTFESALLLSVACLGFETVYNRLIINPEPDAMLRLAIRDSRQQSVCGCLLSYTRDYYDYLAFKERLPDREVYG